MHKITRILFTLILAIGVTAPLAIPAISCPGGNGKSCALVTKTTKTAKTITPKKACPKHLKKVCNGKCPAKCKK